jgi:hypothetical protein
MLYVQEAEKLHANKLFRTCVLAVQLTIKVGLNKVGNQEKLLKHSVKVVVCYQFRAYDQTYCHRPQYQANKDTRPTDVGTKKYRISA